MPNIGPLELAIVLIIALVIFGPKRLPELGKSLGNGLREFKNSVSSEPDDDDPPEIDNDIDDEDEEETVVEAASESSDEPAAQRSA